MADLLNESAYLVPQRCHANRLASYHMPLAYVLDTVIWPVHCIVHVAILLVHMAIRYDGVHIYLFHTAIHHDGMHMAHSVTAHAAAFLLSRVAAVHSIHHKSCQR